TLLAALRPPPSSAPPAMATRIALITVTVHHVRNPCIAPMVLSTEGVSRPATQPPTYSEMSPVMSHQSPAPRPMPCSGTSLALWAMVSPMAVASTAKKACSAMALTTPATIAPHHVNVRGVAATSTATASTATGRDVSKRDVVSVVLIINKLL